MVQRNSYLFNKGLPEFYAPLHETLEEVEDDLNKLKKYAKEVGSPNQIGVYSAMRILGYKTPIGLDEYKYDIYLDSAEVYETKYGTFGCKFKTKKCRTISDDPSIRYSWNSDIDPKIYH